jgi:EmrB/QacA subfamily drug resistance transporter
MTPSPLTSPQATAPSPPRQASTREIRKVYVGMMVVLGLSALDQSIVSTALPRIVAELGGLSHLSWVVTAYVLASTSTMPLYGKLSDQFGRRPLILTAIVTFLLGSALCGMAHSLMQLIVFRAIQGLGAGGFMPLSQIIIGDLVPPAQRGRRQGGIAAVYAVCSVLGPILGGVITGMLSWHWIFYINLPLGIAAVMIMTRALPRKQTGHAARIDYLGSLLLTGGTTAFLLVLALGGVAWAWASPQITALAALTAAIAMMFVWHVRRIEDPVLPLDLFHNRLFVVACAVMALTFMGLLGASVFFPLLFQLVMGVSPARSGLLTGPLMIGVVLSSVFNGRVLLRSGRYKPAQVAGLAGAVLAFATVAWSIATARGLIIIEPAIFALGLGLGLIMPNMTIAVQNALPGARRGVGTAMLAFFRSLGGLVGVTGSGAMLARQLHASTGGDLSAHIAMVSVYRQAIGSIFMLGTAIVAVAFVLLLTLPELPLRAHTPD